MKMKMPNYMSKLRPSAIASSARRSLSRFARPSSFSCPQSPSQILPRVRRNFSSFKVHYCALLWISLLLSLASRHKPTMLFLMAASKIAFSYEVLLKAVPATWRLLRRALDRRLMLAAFLGAILVELALTGAMGRLGLAMGVGMPVVLMHAAFRVGEDQVSGSDPEAKEGEAGRDPTGEKKVDADLTEAGAIR